MSARHRGDKPAGRKRDDARPEINQFRARHLDLATRDLSTADGIQSVLVNDSESPLAWLARRKGRDGRSLIGADQFVAGERLRADFTRGHLSPRVTSSWEAPTGRSGASASPAEITDSALAARQRVRLALEEVGPEFSGILLDVCCFLSGLEDVERERGWPSRSAKVVLQLALDRLARHYGLGRQTSGEASARIRTWLADDAGFVVR